VFPKVKKLSNTDSNFLSENAILIINYLSQTLKNASNHRKTLQSSRYLKILGLKNYVLMQKIT